MQIHVEQEQATLASNKIAFKVGKLIVLFSTNIFLKDRRFNFALFPPGCEQFNCSIDYCLVSQEAFNETVDKYFGTERERRNHCESPSHIFLDDDLAVIKDFTQNSCQIITTSIEVVERSGIDTLYFDMEAKIFANLSFLLSQLSVKHNGIILHGAGLVRHGHAYIFLAVDEGGKTTLIRKNSEHHILSDDQIFFTISSAGNLQADATPFSTVTDGPWLTDVKGIFLIHKSSTHEITRADNLNLLLSLIYDNTSVFKSLPKEIKKQAFVLLHTIAYSTPVFHLKTDYGYIDWDYLDQCVAAAEKEIAKSGIPLHKRPQKQCQRNDSASLR